MNILIMLLSFYDEQGLGSSVFCCKRNSSGQFLFPARPLVFVTKDIVLSGKQ
jgi:hypothetical protein